MVSGPLGVRRTVGPQRAFRRPSFPVLNSGPRSATLDQGSPTRGMATSSARSAALCGVSALSPAHRSSPARS